MSLASSMDCIRFDQTLSDNIRAIQNLLKAEAPPDRPNDFNLGYVNMASTPDGRSNQFGKAILHAYDRLGQILDKGSGMELIRPWTSEFSLEMKQHLGNLKIPTIDCKPSLLLHRLGEEDPVALEDSVSRAARLDTIFLKEESTYGRQHAVLFNTSGAGKTRLVLEGLCRNWGFYFTCQRDVSECGSADLQCVLEMSGRGFLKACGLEAHADWNTVKHTENQECAERCFLAALVARLMVFQCFLAVNEAQGKKTMLHDLKKTWLFVQLDNDLLARPSQPDLMLELTALLCYMPKPGTLTPLSDKLLMQCKEFLANLPSEDVSSPKHQVNIQEVAKVRIYCVLDEVQSAASSFPNAFWDQSGIHQRPALRELLRLWSVGMHCVITGTSLNIKDICEAVSSTMGKATEKADVPVNDTGSFILERSKIDRFLMSYLPPKYLNTPIGRELSRRVNYWLVGRPRFIASFIQYLVTHDFQNCHGLLTSYIQALTKFTPADGTFWEKQEGPMPISTSSLPVPFNLERALMLHNSLLDSVQSLVNHRLMRGRTDFESSGEGLVNVNLVECGFARFPGVKYPDPIFDEPLAYLAADFWINTWVSRHDYFVRRIDQNSPEQNELERYIALCLAHIFRDFTLLTEFFKFADNLGNPAQFADNKARLVSCWIDSSNQTCYAPVHFPFTNKVDQYSGRVVIGTSSPANILAYSSTGPSDDLDWLQFKINAPFLFPTEAFGPDILFRLQLEGGQLLTVALQVKLRESGSAPTNIDGMTKAVNRVDPSKFWLDKKGKVYAPKSYPRLPSKTLKALDQLPYRLSEQKEGYHSLICGLFAFPACENQVMCDKILAKLDSGEVKFNSTHEFFMILTDPIIQVTNTMEPGNALARMELIKKRKSASYIAFYLTHVLKSVDNYLFSDIFRVLAPPAWLATTRKSPTQLVKLKKDKHGVIKEMIITPSALLPDAPPLGYSACSADDVLAWLRHERPGAFCLCPTECEADLIFVLKRCEAYLWVMLRTSGRNEVASPDYVYPDNEREFMEDGVPPWGIRTLSSAELRSEYKCLTVENLFHQSEIDSERESRLSDDLLDALKALPNALAPTGHLSLLRVVAAFPSEPTSYRQKVEESPVAVLNTTTFKTVTEAIPPQDLIQALVFSMHGKRRSQNPDEAFSTIKPLPSKKQSTKRKTRETSSKTSPIKGVSEHGEPSVSETKMISDVEAPSDPEKNRAVTLVKRAKRKSIRSRPANT